MCCILKSSGTSIHPTLKIQNLPLIRRVLPYNFLPLFLKSCSNNIHTPLRSLCQRCPWLSSKQIWCQTAINTTNSAQGFDKRCIFSFNTTLSFRASEDVSICSKKIHQTSTARLANLCLPRDMFASPHLLKLFCANLSKSEFLCSPVPCVNKSICKPVHLYVREENHISISCVQWCQRGLCCVSLPSFQGLQRVSVAGLVPGSVKDRLDTH